MYKPKALDLFSGCGGLSQGLKKAGFRVVGAIEMEHLASDSYELNHPHVRIWRKDIRSLDPLNVMRELELEPGELDLLAGCPPCQGFSTMKTRNGNKKINDSANDLIFEFLNFIDIFKPKSIMLENVPGLAKDARYQSVKNSLICMGYKLIDGILDVSKFGVPQRRKRLILLGGKGFEVSLPKEERNFRTVRDAIYDLPPAGDSGDGLHDFPEQRDARVNKMISLIPKDGGSRSDLPEQYKLQCHKRIDGYKDVYGRMSWDKVAPTITGGCVNPSKGRFLHPVENRSITLREAALLQTFPRTYKFSLEKGKFAVAQMIGNAIPPQFIRRQAAQLKKSLKE